MVAEEPKGHAFIHMLTTAWTKQYPIQMDPQNLWLIILQSASQYLHSQSLSGKSIVNPLVQRGTSKFNKIRLTPLPSMNMMDTTSDRDCGRRPSMVLEHSYDFSTTGTLNNKEWRQKMKEFI